MKIERILKKGKANVLIEFDNNEKLILALEVFMKSGLRKNDNLSVDRFSSLITENRLFFIRQRAFRLLGRRLHSTGELRNKLLEKLYDKQLVESVIEELQLKKYLNDQDFASQFVREKVYVKKWSRKKIYSELIKRNIKRQLIESVLEGNISEDDDYKNALIVGEKKYKTLLNRKLEKSEARGKLITFLKMKGYSFSTIKKVCEKLIRL